MGKILKYLSLKSKDWNINTKKSTEVVMGERKERKNAKGVT